MVGRFLAAFAVRKVALLVLIAHRIDENARDAVHKLSALSDYFIIIQVG
jgi:hypothetical protein